MPATNSDDSLRLQVYLSRCGLGSRRKCESYITSGRVKVNGITVMHFGTRVNLSDTVSFDARLVEQKSAQIYVVLNKPAGFICSDYDPENRPLAKELLESSFTVRLFNVGRLDHKSTGLIFFTNDGEFCRKVSHPSQAIEKEYEILTRQEIPDTLLERFVKGITIDGIKYQAVYTKRLGSRRVRIVLHEGKNREIRRVFQDNDLSIKSIHRIRIGSIKVNGLRMGRFRHLTESEVRELLLTAGKR